MDPVRAKRQKVAKWTLLANRVGYLFFALAIAVFVIAFAVGFNDAVSAIIIASIVIGSVLLAPAIVLGYAVKAAEREDRERGL
jgi:Na+/proline symporter